MNLLSKLGRQTLRIGSSDACEIVISGEGVAPVHAEIVHRGGGRLSFVATSAGTSSLDGRPLKPGVEVPFDFRSLFYLGSVPLPLTHPGLCLMVMGRGEKPLVGHELLVGRDPERCHLVLNSPGVSALHATLDLSTPPSVTDHKSTSGTWLKGQRIPTEEKHPLTDDSVLSVGPLPLPVRLARDLLLELEVQKQAPRRPAATEAMPRRTVEQRAVSRPLSRPTKHRTVMGTVKMVGTKSHTIGRTSENDIVLDYAQISGRHAKLTIIAGQVFIEDLSSEHGTQVRGTRLKPGQKAKVDDGDRILLGPMPALLTIVDDQVDVVIEDQEGWAGRPLFTVSAANVSVEVADRDDSSKTKTLLDRVSFKALPGDFVALMGPSGSGKTTLLHALTGYRVPTSGEVRVNDRPLSQVFESLRGSIGYVPQDDIIHPELTVFEAVRYSARFRLPSDYSEDEVNRRVQTTLIGLGLEAVAHLQIGRPEAKVLSGGQRKRVNIAMELVTDPVLLFLDEPTSGLAADDTTALVALLARLAADDGKTIIATIHQPARDEYEKFNLALILGHGGIPLYFGATEDAYFFFESWRGPHEMRGIETPRAVFAELNEREARLKQEDQGSKSRQEIRVAVAEAFRRDYEGSDVARSMIATERAVGVRKDATVPVPNRAHPKGQLGLLLARYFKIKSRDTVGTAILMLQAPLIGVLLSLVFAKMKPAVPYWCLGALSELAKKNGRSFNAAGEALSQIEPTSDHAGALFFLVVAAVWFGTSNAAREIVSERAIFRRERMVNLGVTNYVLSKFLILALLCIVQCSILLAIVFPSLGLAGGGSAFLSSLLTLSLTAISSVALGLVLSTVVKSSEAAMALTPIALIPQVVLGGLMVPVTTNALLKIPMLAMPSRWGFEGVVRTERYGVAQQSGWKIPVDNVTESLPDFIRGGSFECALAQLESSQLTGAWALHSPQWLPSLALTLMTTGSLGLVVVLLKRRG